MIHHFPFKPIDQCGFQKNTKKLKNENYKTNLKMEKVNKIKNLHKRKCSDNWKLRIMVCHKWSTDTFHSFFERFLNICWVIRDSSFSVICKVMIMIDCLVIFSYFLVLSRFISHFDNFLPPSNSLLSPPDNFLSHLDHFLSFSDNFLSSCDNLCCSSHLHLKKDSSNWYSIHMHFTSIARLKISGVCSSFFISFF